MAATGLGEAVTPADLNALLINRSGYTREGWIIWDAISKSFDGRIEAVAHDRPSFEALDRAIEQGEFPIVKFLLPSGITHWVVIVGKEGSDYLIHDPLLVQNGPVLLSERTDRIYSLRVIRRKT